MKIAKLNRRTRITIFIIKILLIALSFTYVLAINDKYLLNVKSTELNILGILVIGLVISLIVSFIYDLYELFINKL